MFKKMVLALLCSVLGLGLIPGKAGAVSVDLELSLVVDISGSVDGTDFNLQRTGYANAFSDAGIINSILTGGTYHSIAVNLVYFSTNAVEAIPWTLIDSQATSLAFSSAISTAARPTYGVVGNQTGITNALNYAVGQFGFGTGGNGFEGDRLVIDVSGDGSESIQCNWYDPICAALQTARNNALTAGIDSINGLAIFDREYFGDKDANPSIPIDAVDYFTNNLIGGTGAFVLTAEDFGAFGAAVQDKLAREITPTPEPGILLLIGSGLLSVVGLRRKFKK